MKTSERERLPFWFVEIRSNRKKERKKEVQLLLLSFSDTLIMQISFERLYDLAVTTIPLWAQCQQAFSYIYHIIGPDPNTI